MHMILDQEVLASEYTCRQGISRWCNLRRNHWLFWAKLKMVVLVGCKYCFFLSLSFKIKVQLFDQSFKFSIFDLDHFLLSLVCSEGLWCSLIFWSQSPFTKVLQRFTLLCKLDFNSLPESLLILVVLITNQSCCLKFFIENFIQLIDCEQISLEPFWEFYIKSFQLWNQIKFITYSQCCFLLITNLIMWLFSYHF